MSSLLGPVAELIVLHGRSLGLRLAYWAVIVAGVMLTTVFLLVALHLWLAPHVGGAPAALLVALVVVLGTAATGAVLLLLAREARYRAQRAQAPLIMSLPLVTPLMRKATPAILVAAMVAGAAFQLTRRR